MRKPLVAGNWKMHGTHSQAKLLVQNILSGLQAHTIDVTVLPPFVYLAPLQALLQANAALALGAQNLYLGTQGAFTGEVSGSMLADCGCQYVLVGHSERRALFHEDLALVAAKFQAALAAGLTPILCVGETQAERESGLTESVIADQVQSVIDAAGIESFGKAVIAYEPVWAIGTGLTASPAQAQASHVFIRQLLAQNNVDIAGAIRILYGGSMKAENASALLSMPDIDGGLVGGASLNAESFLAICHAAESRLALQTRKQSA